MVTSLAIILTWLGGVAFGILLVLGLMVVNMLNARGWDKSNMTNALRMLAHLAKHPADFVHMFYVVRAAGDPTAFIVSRRCFPYLGLDETTEVVKTRPTHQEQV